MYTVIWDDHEGIRHELLLDAREDAEIEAAALRERFDYVEINPLDTHDIINMEG